MGLIEQAVDAVASWGGKRESDRARCVQLLEQARDQMRGALDIWSASRDQAPESGDRFTAVMWIGAEPARQLQAIHFQIKETAAALTALTGVRFKDTLDLAEELDIVQPYDQLGPGESGADRAESAIRVLKARKQRIEEAIDKLRK